IGLKMGDEEDRLSGYRRALRENNLEIDERRIQMVGRVSIDAGRSAAKEVLERSPEITGITCYNDLMAIGALQACAELGWRVPDDIAIVGFDDIPLASLVNPALTTMHVPRYQLGEMVMQLLLRVMAADGAFEEHLWVEPRLIIRDSCGARGIKQVAAP